MGKKIKKIQRRKKAVAATFGIISIVGLLASCGAQGSGKKDKNGNPLAYSVTDESGKNHNQDLASFLKSITNNTGTSSEEFTSVQNQLYKFLYTKEQEASVIVAKKASDDSIKLDTLKKQRESAQKFFDDEKKSYQQTYRDKWEEFWIEHLLTTYHAKSEAQAVENKMAETIKNDALRRYQLQITDTKQDKGNPKFTVGDFNVINPPAFFNGGKGHFNVYAKNFSDFSSRLEVMMTKSFSDEEKNPYNLIKGYSDFISDKGSSTNNDDSLFVSNWQVNFKPGATQSAAWTVEKKSLTNLYSLIDNSSGTPTPVGKLLFDNGIDLTTATDSINNLSNRSSNFGLYSDGEKTGDSTGVVGNIFVEDINQKNLKPGVGIGLINGLKQTSKSQAIPKLNTLAATIGGTAETGLYNILTAAINKELGKTGTPNANDINGLSATNLTNIGEAIRDAFNIPSSGTSNGRELTYLTNNSSQTPNTTTYVTISTDGLNFVSARKLNPFDPSPTTVQSFDPSVFSARIQNDLKAAYNKQKSHFNIADTISESMSKGVMVNYPLRDQIKNKEFTDYLKTQTNYSKENNPKFDDSDVKTITDILKTTTAKKATLVPKNGTIYKWISDYYDANSSSQFPLINPNYFNFDEIYNYIKEHEGVTWN